MSNSTVKSYKDKRKGFHQFPKTYPHNISILNFTSTPLSITYTNCVCVFILCNIIFSFRWMQVHELASLSSHLTPPTFLSVGPQVHVRVVYVAAALLRLFLHTQHSLPGFVTDGYTWASNGRRACFVDADQRVWLVLVVWCGLLDRCWRPSWAVPHGLHDLTLSLHDIQFLRRARERLNTEIQVLYTFIL